MRRLLLAGFGAVILAVPTASLSLRYVLPEEKPVVLPPGAGADLTGAFCAACHSLDYLATQPRGKGPQFWRDSVTKMVNVYKAPVPPDAAAAISDYLASTYGANPP